MQRQQLILVPGLLNDAELWRDQVQMLSADVDCIVADITSGGTLRELAEATLHAATASRFSLAGFSLGGYVAQEVMRIASERVDRLALLDTSIDADTAERAASRRTVSRSAASSGRFHGFGDRLLKSYLAASNLGNAEIVQRIRDMTARLGSDVLTRQNAIERRDGRDVLAQLQCPLLVLCGEHDTITTLAHHREIAALAGARANLVVIPDSGHLTPIENPQAVTQALRDWLREGTENRAIGRENLDAQTASGA